MTRAISDVSGDGRGTLTTKRLVKLALSIVYFAAWRGLVAPAWRLLGRRPKGTAVVLYYHAVPPDMRPRFARQMDILARSATPVRADWMGTAGSGRRYCAVTFDDGFAHLMETALPELANRQIPCTLFVIADALGQIPGWMIEDADSGRLARLLTADELTRLSSDLITIGAHTLTHPSLISIQRRDAEREIRGSRERLEAILHRPVTLFSFPYGEFNSELIAIGREAGFQRVFTTLPYTAFSEPGEFVTGRVWVEPSDWPLEFRLKLAGAYNWLPAALSVKRKLFGARPQSSSQPRPMPAR